MKREGSARHGFPGVNAVGPIAILAIALNMCAVVAHAGAAIPLPGDDSARRLHGAAPSTPLDIGGYQVGRAEAFFGVDDRSTTETQYLTSGVNWRLARDEFKSLKLSMRHTEARGAQTGGQVDARAQAQMDTGRMWFLPTFNAEFEHRRAAQPGLLSGNTLRFGVRNEFGPNQFGVQVFRTDDADMPLVWGPQTATRGVAFNTKLRGPRRIHLSSRVVAREPIANAGQARVGQRLSLEGPLGLVGQNANWHVRARYGAGQHVVVDNDRPLNFGIGLSGLPVGDWRIQSTLGWYRDLAVGPNALPVEGGMGRLDASRILDLEAGQATITPEFAIGQSAGSDNKWAGRGGISLAFSRARNRVSLNVDYTTDGWRMAAGGAATTGMLTYTRAGAFGLAGLW
ncbi:hypothetical protein HKX42_09990 [Salinisphaera sp. USBA-960]|nr:hypothetical protein [Salifodinibacter halophilus]NNC27203.1 hypothetical protein [Salifodinibacter halophilus]